jgi:hypothetical protein
MTLGIAVLCDHGETIVMGSEQRATYGTTSAVGPNDECGKQFYMKPYNVFVSVAGSLSVCQKIYAQLAHMVENLKDRENIPPELMATLVDEARFHEMKRIYDWKLKQTLGVDLRGWAAGKLPGGVRMNKTFLEYGELLLQTTPLKCELIVAGFINGKGIFLRACQKREIEEETSPGNYAIGTGQADAMRQLNKRGQNVHCKLPSTLLNVYEALYVSQSQYVGPPPELLSIFRMREQRIMVYHTKFLESWRKTYENRASTKSLDDSGVAGREVLARIRVMKDGSSK